MLVALHAARKRFLVEPDQCSQIDERLFRVTLGGPVGRAGEDQIVILPELALVLGAAGGAGRK